MHDASQLLIDPRGTYPAEVRRWLIEVGSLGLGAGARRVGPAERVARGREAGRARGCSRRRKDRLVGHVKGEDADEGLRDAVAGCGEAGVASGAAQAAGWTAPCALTSLYWPSHSFQKSRTAAADKQNLGSVSLRSCVDRPSTSCVGGAFSSAPGKSPTGGRFATGGRPVHRSRSESGRFRSAVGRVTGGRRACCEREGHGA